MRLSSQTRVLVYTTSVDMRRSFDGLCGVVRNYLHEDPSKGGWFVFFNRRGDQVKILYHDGNGYAVWSKRLHHGVYSRPRSDAEGSIPIDIGTLEKILMQVRSDEDFYQGYTR